MDTSFLLVTTMLGQFELAFGLLIWGGVLWDGFATVVLPSTVAPMRRLSGRFTRWSWRLWAAAARRILLPEMRLNFLAVYGPFSVMLLLALGGVLMIVAFALIYHGLGPRFQAVAGPIGFGTLLYMSGSTFLTLGLGDVTSSDPLGRSFILLEAGSGYAFLALIITYMPLLDQAYGAREVGSMLIHSRAGHPPGAIWLLSHYSQADRSDVLRGNLREAEHWMAATLQSHLSHPVLSLYRAQRWGQSWLVSLATVLDSCALMIVGGEGLAAAQASLTYRMGVRLLEDLMEALSIQVDRRCSVRLTEADMPALVDATKSSGLALTLGPGNTPELLQLVRRYDAPLVTLAAWLVIPLPSWVSLTEPVQERGTPAEPDGLDD
jgi:Ion channel